MRDGGSLQFLCFEETWRGNSYALSFPGYREITEYNRVCGSGGGLCIKTRSHLVVEPIDVSRVSVDKHLRWLQ